ncbi:MAG: hypothetical protein AAB857_01810 [Patescibacteria group bacterium]
MFGIGCPVSVESLHRNYATSEELCSTKEGRAERNHVFLGVTLTSSLEPSVVYPFGVRSRYITIPQNPTLLQKIIAFLLVQGMVAKLARREEQWIDYAFSWLNAREIFDW